ncbi:MAG: VCBS repeat-containing protein [Phaeodactylibacter sp.]|nr:VCBS repeat-containing protein [Phaeodactylibacter sp.]
MKSNKCNAEPFDQRAFDMSELAGVLRRMPFFPSFITGNVESTGVVSWMDYDQDCDPDLFMIKSGHSHPTGMENNRFYHNVLRETGTLGFQRVFTAGLVNHLDLDFQASWGDYDNDGDMMDISELAPGFYYLCATSRTTTVSKKLIIQ